MTMVKNTQTTEQGYNTSCYPIAKWMRYGLGLKGVDLLIFATVFTMTIDKTIEITYSLEEMADMIGITRQTLAKKLAKLPGIVTTKSQDNADGSAYTHNVYTFNTDVLYSLCEQAGSEILEDYNNTLKGVIVINFPDKQEEVKAYVDKILENYGNKPKEEQHNIHKSMMTTASTYDRMMDTDYYTQNINFNIYSFEGIYHIMNTMCKNADNNVIPLLHSLKGSYTEFLQQNGLCNLSNVAVENTIAPEVAVVTVSENPVNSNEVNTDDVIDVTFPTDKSETAIVSTDSTNSNGSSLPLDAKGRRLNVVSGATLAKKEEEKKAKKNKSKSKTNSLIKDNGQQPKKRGPKSKRAVMCEKLHIMNEGFVAMECDNDQRVLDALNRFADKRTINAVDANHVITDEQDWQDLLSKYYDCPNEVIVADANDCASNNYKRNGFKVDEYYTLLEFADIVKNYVNSLPEYSEELEDLLIKYVSDVSYEKCKLSSRQLESLVQTLNRFPTNEIRIEVVRSAWASNFKSFVLTEDIKTRFASVLKANNTAINVEIDMDKKLQAVDDLICSEYLCLVPNIRESLTEYINSDIGKTIAVADFKKTVKDLMYYGVHDDSDGIESFVQSAIEEQHPYLYKVSNKDVWDIEKSYGSKDKYEKEMRRIRYGHCYYAYHDIFTDNEHLFPQRVIDEILADSNR